MSIRIAFWTSEFDPEMEAFSSEVALLRSQFPSSIAWGLSDRHWVLFSRRRGYCVHPRLHILFRLTTRLLERAFQINHIFGTVGDWYYLIEEKRRPTVLTMAALSGSVKPALLQRVSQFVVEHPAGRAHLQNLGIDSERIRL